VAGGGVSELVIFQDVALDIDDRRTSSENNAWGIDALEGHYVVLHLYSVEELGVSSQLNETTVLRTVFSKIIREYVQSVGLNIYWLTTIEKQSATN
jgi:hypothetical protein